ncbi:efflux RND transporter periplasmic adaptor subunit [Pontibacter sp. BT310]|uniref:Efflux RND transporter periplasmic adaptor subunit n=1 Tax=Pontibacter populi TaxID=890055 RepID=A0ABS6XAV2_9BACT|nr:MULTISPECIES: efflux RND transporter periplasmic adaptor subunit [Pontibacter]MBJ6118270.1 efflux RND transporter periplasmic adaptor subunit [Pontibacter sp. BT310]MBR0570697.1 efflux RND transporter periplasmic adaptor subunit [Microvirga sp. STS03]MBW3365123.1 efflux RND transporter periplasmic adaptor subunit [Pontibacter populi]
MKRYLNILLLVLAIVVAACSGEDHNHAEGATEYTCPMHPQIVQNKPGTCPICGMDLVPKTAHGDGVEITEELAFLLKPTNTTVIANIATIKPEQKTAEATVKMDGVITYDPRRVYSVPAKVGGRIEKLFVKYNFQPIRKGQKLMEIYSPDLITAQKELLYLVQSAPEDKQLIQAARQKLQYLGATNEQINRLIRNGEESYTFAVYSPYNGYVIDLNASAPNANAAPAPAAGTGGGMDAMGGGTSSAATPTTTTPAGQTIQLREGMYVTAGQPLVRVVNAEQLWAEFNVPAGDNNPLTKGAPVVISFPQLPGEKLEAKVDFVQPFFSEGENFAKVRVYLPGSNKLAMVGQLVTGEASYKTDSALWVPREAVLNIGTKHVAFRKSDGGFEPVAVTIGTNAGKEVQIISGLKETDVIATNAQFLVDSESFIKVSN